MSNFMGVGIFWIGLNRADLGCWRLTLNMLYLVRMNTKFCKNKQCYPLTDKAYMQAPPLELSNNEENSKRNPLDLAPSPNMKSFTYITSPKIIGSNRKWGNTARNYEPSISERL